MKENTENENNAEDTILPSNGYHVEPCLPEPSPTQSEDYSAEQKKNDLDDAAVTGSRGGLVNTPASLFTDFSEYKSG